MKILFTAALVLAGIKEREAADPDCKQNACAMDLTAKLPEQHHASEEPPTFEATAVTYWNQWSPTTSMSREQALEHIREYGPDSITVYTSDWKIVPFS
jgi:hypothetical protein